MPKIVKFEGKTYNVPDDATMEEIDALITGRSSTPTVAPAKPPAEPPSDKMARQMMFGASPLELRERLIGGARQVGKIGLGGIQLAQYLMDKKVSPIPTWLEPKTGEEAVGRDLANIAMESAPIAATGGMGLPARVGAAALAGGMASESPTGAVVGGAIPVASQGVAEFLRRLPSTARAGQKFEQVMAKAQDQPLDLTDANQAVARAQELRERGSSLPKVLNDFMKNRKNATGDFMGTPVQEPMTYRVGRDFASNASALSSREATALNAKMQQQVREFSGAMRDANRKAAERVGMGDLYDQAMKEYRQAKNIQEAMEIVKKWSLRAGASLVGLKVAGEVWESVTDR